MRRRLKQIKNTKQNLKQNNAGSATVTVLGIILILIVFFMLVIDGVKIVNARKNADSAAKLSLNGALANYDREIKDAYGLYVYNGNEATLNAEVRKYFVETVAPNESANIDTSGKSSLLGMNANVSAHFVDGSQLSNEAVFRTQIYEYMKYYGFVVGDVDEMFCELNLIGGETKVLIDKYRVDLSFCKIQKKLDDIYTYIDNGGDENSDYVNNLITQMYAEFNALPGLYASWESELANLSLPANFKLRMTSDLNYQKNYFDYERAKTDMDYLTSFAEDEVEHDAAYDQLLSNRKAKLKKCNTNTWNFGGVDNGSYPNTEYQTPLVYRVVDADKSEEEMLVELISNLEKIASVYDRVDEALALANSVDERLSIALYASEMFSAYKSWPNKTLNQYDYFNGVIKDANPFSENEYLVYGKSTPKENVKATYTQIVNLVFIENLFEYYATKYSDVDAAYENAKKINGDVSLKNFISQDIFLLAECLSYTSDWVNESLENYQGVSCYRGSRTVWLSYRDYLKIFMLMEALDNSSVILNRIKSCITMNVRTYKPDFSFDTAYTGIELDATVHVNTTVLGTNTFTINRVAGY